MSAMAEATLQRGFVRHGGRQWSDYFVFNTDHKVIGIQYIVTTFVFFIIGGLLAMIIRAELAQPGMQLVDGAQYNALFTIHGTIMIFLWVIPGLIGMANYVVPLMIGADDMAFPRLNALSYWVLLVGGVLMIDALLVGGAKSGWTAYPPLATQVPFGQTLWAISVFIIGFSSILGALNFLVTIFLMRTPGMGLTDMPLLCWAMVATSIIILFGTPMLTAGLVLQIMDRVAGTRFFQEVGDPLLWQHMFWFYSHPAVYIMILPAMGFVSEILPVFARKPIFGYKPIAFSSMAIAIVGFLVWAHHMFTSGMNPLVRIPYMVTSMIVAVPTGVKVFSWLGTIWGGKLNLNTAMLHALGFISLFVLGGISGVFLASIPIDIHVHDSYFVVAHLHYVLFGGSTMAMFGALYYWFPKMTGRRLHEGLGKLHFWLTFVGFNATFLPQHLLGLQGMPRRVVDYAPEFATVNLLSSLGAFLLGVSVLPFLINILLSLVRGKVASANPWRALTLEWSVSSPPPVHNFPQRPVVSSGPYDYGADQPVPATTSS